MFLSRKIFFVSVFSTVVFNNFQKLKEEQKKELEKLKKENFAQFAIKGSEEDWERALSSGTKAVVSIKR